MIRRGWNNTVCHVIENMSDCIARADLVPQGLMPGGHDTLKDIIEAREDSSLSSYLLGCGMRSTSESVTHPRLTS